MDYREIRRLVKLVESSQINELEIEIESSKVRIVKNSGNLNMPGASSVMMQSPFQPMPLPAVADEADMGESSQVAAPQKQTNIHEVNSPMVGTYYRAPSPEAPPYIQIGDIVKPGQVLCIIEAMKLMNEIECEVSGKIVEIVIEDAQPVEYAQLLLKIELA